ncbi:hypothetical protein G8770_23700 [Aestuariicella hydrocarbonica]|uniref:Uncharacterized protein n=1 Tax=Pseudomaricurvus hydrocarbonicus TaxID=1470433 RepID=A0A9E5T552_9GAMM|nr:hypothetical protein [Aestuariicella hydrocarbonica]NHO68569.1 hypothetical protein [Aestuariicella hydrocarbonica]
MRMIDWYDVYVYIGGFSLIIMSIAWLIFGITTMRKLDKAIVEEGKPRPCQWDPMWWRAHLYTWPIIFSGKSFSELENRIIDTQDVKKNINTYDKVLSWILFLSNCIMINCLLIGWILDLY